MLLLAILSLLISKSLFASEHVLRPKIGLALSGGGARGAAHIGVLKRLEELNVPIDYIAGTSMGAIIGGLYASGYSADQLQSVVANIDWDTALSDRTARTSLSMRKKLDENDYFIDFGLGIDSSGLHVPKGVLQGQNLGLVLSHLFNHVMLVKNFDEMPIPYRAVASDIETGDAVVISQGDIVRAVQASMSVPGVFSPMKIDGKVLVDGGVAQNLPIDVVRDMGADIVIAVNISTPLTTEENLHSAIDILDQLTNILTHSNVRQQLETLTEKDLYIRPQLGDISSAEFSRAVEAVQLGAKAVHPHQQKLRALSIDGEAYATYRTSVGDLLADSHQWRPDYVTVRQNSGLSSDALKSRLRTVPGKPLDEALLNEDIASIYALGIFQTVRYHLQDNNGLTGLVIDAKEKEWGPNYLNFGIRLEDDFEGASDYSLVLGLRRRPINRLGGELNGLLKAGSEPRIAVEFFQPFDSLARKYSLFSLETQQARFRIYDNEQLLAEYKIRSSELAAYLGAQSSNNLDFRIGLKRSVGQATRQEGDDRFPQEGEYEDGSLTAELRYDTLDSRAFPRKGRHFALEYLRSYEALGADIPYANLLLNGVFVQPVGDLSLSVNAVLGTTTEGEAPFASLFRLGGFLNLSGYSRNQLSGQHAALLGLGGHFRLSDRQIEQLSDPIYVGAVFETGNVWQEKSDASTNDLRYSASIFAGTETPFGPVYLGYGQAEEGRSAFYFTLGYVF